MPMTLVHRPRSARRMNQDVQNEINRSYNYLCINVIMRELNSDVSDWSKKPNFFCRVKVTRSRWQLEFGYDGRTTGGKWYKWSDVGTGERSGIPGRTAYKIRPKKKKALRYNVPYYPKTLPTDGRPKTNIQYTDTPTAEVIRQEVTHPGIWPRNFTQSLRDELSNPSKIGGFKSVTEAAVKRVYRRQGIY